MWGGHTPFENCKDLTMHYNYEYTAADYGEYAPGTDKPTTPPTTEKTYTPKVAAGGVSEEIKTAPGGITVVDKKGAFEDGVAMNVTAKSSTDTSFSFEITFTKDGKEVQPNGKVTVKVPLPKALRGGSVYVYHGDAFIKSTSDGDFVVFETDSFSPFTITSKMSLDPGTTEPATPTDPGATEPATPTDPDDNNGNSGNPTTGIALAIAPVLLAGAAVIVISKRK